MELSIADLKPFTMLYFTLFFLSAVSVIDYRQPAIERAYKCFDVLYLLKNVFHLKKVYTYLKEFGNRKQTSVVFEG